LGGQILKSWFYGCDLVVPSGKIFAEWQRRNEIPPDKQNFFRLIGTITILPLVMTFWFVPKTGLLLFVVLLLLLTIPFFLLPGALLPEGWLTKRWIRQKTRGSSLTR
jgi:hypothetical protein